MSYLNAAVIGTGFIGPIHVEALQRAGVTVTGILGSSPEKSRAAAVAVGVPIGYESVDHLLSDSSVDVVHITSPNRFHFDQAKESLRAGKHVLCEKPLAMDSRESTELVRLAKETGRAAGVNYNIRYYPLCLESSQRMRDGQLGELLHITGSYAQDWLFHKTDFNWRVLSDDGGPLRAVADIGTHWLDLIQFIVGQPITSVCADLSTIYPVRQRPIGGIETFSGKVDENQSVESINVDTEDYGAVMLRFAGGGKGVLWVSQVTAGRKNCLRFELAGSREAIHWSSEVPNELCIGHRDRPNEKLIRDPALVGSRARDAISYPGGHNEGFSDTFKQLFRDFYAQIESGDYHSSATYPTFDDGHHEILMCEAILRSHRQQCWVNVGE
ncbi:MAG: Gfo/Idh/MocA family oxidoreductase [Pirellulaceae bacterium]|nr:Gfo/Idh/MocA family oxidoreductase [Pirellulaceae bacterium]